MYHDPGFNHERVRVSQTLSGQLPSQTSMANTRPFQIVQTPSGQIKFSGISTRQFLVTKIAQFKTGQLNIPFYQPSKDELLQKLEEWTGEVGDE